MGGGKGVVAAGWTGVPHEAAKGVLLVFGIRFLKLGKSLGAPKLMGEADTKEQSAETSRRVECISAMRRMSTAEAFVWKR